MYYFFKTLLDIHCQFEQYFLLIRKRVQASIETNQSDLFTPNDY